MIRDREEGLVDGVIFHPRASTPSRSPACVPTLRSSCWVRPRGRSTDHVMIDNIAPPETAIDMLLRRPRRIAFLGMCGATSPSRPTSAYSAIRRRSLRQASGLTARLVLESDGFGSMTVSAPSRGPEAGAISTPLSAATTSSQWRLSEGSNWPAYGARRCAVLGWDDTSLARYSTPAPSRVSPDKPPRPTAFELLGDRMNGYDGPATPHRAALNHERATT